jgi:hypothetical protein
MSRPAVEGEHARPRTSSNTHRGSSMSIAKVLEITAESKKSFKDAIRKGVERANETVKGIEGAWIKEQKVLIKKGEIVGYRVDMKVTFVLEE